ncbi:unnamed protein product, partial [Effrenium voratum]
EYPHDLALAPGVLYICELYAVRALDITSEPPMLRTVFQSEYGLGGVAVAREGLVVALHSRHMLALVDNEGREQILAGTGHPGPLLSDAPALQGNLHNPTKVAVLPSQDILFIDAGNRALRLLQRASGTLVTLSGAIDAPDGLALGGGGCFVAEGRNCQ